MQPVDNYYKVVKVIHLGHIKDQLNGVERIVNDVAPCVLPDGLCFDAKKLYSFNNQINDLKHELDVVFSLFGHSEEGRRPKRSLNFIGSGLKFMFGTMDHDDFKLIHKAINDISKQSNNIIDVINDEHAIISNFSRQAHKLVSNQKVLVSELKELKNEYRMEKRDRIVEQAELKVKEIFHSIEIQIMKAHNAILFAKSGVLDPYFIEPEEVLREPIMQKLNYIVNKTESYDFFSRCTYSVAAVKNKTNIVIVVDIPLAAQRKFELYESLVLPKADGRKIVSLVGIPRYFAIHNGTNSFENETLTDCVIIRRQYICKDVLVRNLGHYRSCVASIFANQTDSLCQYKEHYKNNFFVYHKMNNGVILFTYEQLKIQMSCLENNKLKTYTRYINESVLILPERSCTVKSELFELKREHFEEEIHLKDKYLPIACCSPFFPKIQNQTETTVPTFQIHDLKDIKDMEGDIVNWDLHRLIKMGKEHFPQFDNDDSSHWNLYIAILVLLIVLYVVYKFQHLIMFCCRRKQKKPGPADRSEQPMLNSRVLYVPDVGLKF